MLSSTLSVSWTLLFQAAYILQSFGKLDNNGVGWRWDAVFPAKTQNTAVEGVYLGALSLFDILKRGGIPALAAAISKAHPTPPTPITNTFMLRPPCIFRKFIKDVYSASASHTPA